MDTCVLCNIDKKYIIYETKYSVCFIYINSIKYGHLAIATKRHTSKLADLYDYEITDLFSLAHRISKIINKKLNEEKLYLLYIGDQLDHYHIHLIPRATYEEKLGPFIFGENGWKSKVYKKISNEENSELIEYLKNELKD